MISGEAVAMRNKYDWSKMFSNYQPIESKDVLEIDLHGPITVVLYVFQNDCGVYPECTRVSE